MPTTHVRRPSAHPRLLVALAVTGIVVAGAGASATAAPGPPAASAEPTAAGAATAGATAVPGAQASPDATAPASPAPAAAVTEPDATEGDVAPVDPAPEVPATDVVVPDPTASRDSVASGPSPTRATPTPEGTWPTWNHSPGREPRVIGGLPERGPAAGGMIFGTIIDNYHPDWGAVEMCGVRLVPTGPPRLVIGHYLWEFVTPPCAPGEGTIVLRNPSASVTFPFLYVGPAAVDSAGSEVVGAGTGAAPPRTAARLATTGGGGRSALLAAFALLTLGAALVQTARRTHARAS